LASAVLITTSRKTAEAAVRETEAQLAVLPRKETASESLENYGAVIVAQSREQAVDLANSLAPEHLEVLFENPLEYIGRIDNASSVFLGAYSPEPLGDYFAGPNHVLPTNGTARFFSPLNVDCFTKKTSYIYYPKAALEKAADDIILIANQEDLAAHANAVKLRVQNNGE
jgi:histidinol dehydrogenase